MTTSLDTSRGRYRSERARVTPGRQRATPAVGKPCRLRIVGNTNYHTHSGLPPYDHDPAWVRRHAVKRSGARRRRRHVRRHRHLSGPQPVPRRQPARRTRPPHGPSCADRPPPPAPASSPRARARDLLPTPRLNVLSRRPDAVAFAPGRPGARSMKRSTRTGEVSMRTGDVSTPTGETSTRTGEVSTRTGKTSTRTGDVSTPTGETRSLPGSCMALLPYTSRRNTERAR